MDERRKARLRKLRASRGGRNRVDNMTPEELSKAARNAVNARWAKATDEYRKAWGEFLATTRIGWTEDRKREQSRRLKAYYAQHPRPAKTNN